MDWFSASDPELMLDLAAERLSDRKLKLFTVACLRYLDQKLVLSEESREAMLMIEAEAEGRPDINAHSAIHDTLLSLSLDPDSSATLGGKVTSRMLDIFTAPPLESSRKAIRITVDVSSTVVAMSARDKSTPQEERRLAARSSVNAALSELLRDVMGASYQLPTVPQPFTTTTRELAQDIYSNLSFDRMHELADQLELEGYSDSILITHCRQAATHVRGCWVLDTILEKK